MNVHKRHSTLLGGRRQFQPQVRPATIELHDVQPLALHDHEPRPRPRAPTKYCLPGGARPNGPRLSCGAELERSQIEDYLRERGAVSFRRLLGSTGAATSRGPGECHRSSRHRLANTPCKTPTTWRSG